MVAPEYFFIPFSGFANIYLHGNDFVGTNLMSLWKTSRVTQTFAFRQIRRIAESGGKSENCVVDVVHQQQHAQGYANEPTSQPDLSRLGVRVVFACVCPCGGAHGTRRLNMHNTKTIIVCQLNMRLKQRWWRRRRR